MAQSTPGSAPTCYAVDEAGQCPDPSQARGLCPKHSSRMRTHGTVMAAALARKPWPYNMLLNMAPQPNGCIWYTGRIDAQGYGSVTITGDRQRPVHRAAYEYFVGPIPDGLHVDHLCHGWDADCPCGPACLHRRCINVDHLEPVTPQENAARGRGGSVNNPRSAQTHCIRGHEFTEANTYRHGNRRHCRTCKIEKQRERRLVISSVRVRRADREKVSDEDLFVGL